MDRRNDELIEEMVEQMDGITEPSASPYDQRYHQHKKKWKSSVR